MPNWSWTQVQIMKGDSDISISRIKEEFTNEEMEVKTPKVGNLTEEEKKDWYNTNVKYLGTKWEFTLDDIQEDDKRLFFRTETAWSEPREFFRELSRRFPGAIIKTLAEYEGEEWIHSEECAENMDDDNWTCINEYDGKKCNPNIYEEMYRDGKGGE